jgi:uncharacterized delta-60 repeat protein
VRYNPDGSLDKSFGQRGIVTTDFNQSVDEATCVAVQANGKIVLGGTTNGYLSYDFALARYNTDGSLDSSFGTRGLAHIDFYQDDDAGYGLAVQADGKVVIAGSAEPGGGFSPVPAIARYETETAQPDCVFPLIGGASISGKNLVVTGNGFQTGAVVLVNGEVQPTAGGTPSPYRTLIAKKAAKRLKSGASVQVQVKNPCGKLSAVFELNRQ